MMTNRYRCISLLVLLFLVSNPAAAQLENLGQVLAGGATDASTLMQAYLQPVGAGFGAGLNTGWTNTARPHKFLGFDLRIGASVVPIPVAERNFTIPQSGLSTLRILNPGIGSSPTFAGNDNAPVYTFVYDTAYDPDGPGPIPAVSQRLAEFNMPGGQWNASDMDGIFKSLPFRVSPAVPAPSVQLSLGLFKNTDIMLRFVPETEMPNFGTIGLMGLGVRHSLSQWLPVLSSLKFLDVSAVGAYTQFNMESPLNLPDPATGQRVTGQMLDWQTNAWNANIVAGITISIPVLRRLVEPHFYVGYGIENSSSTMNILGRYGYKVANPLSGIQSVAYVNDPVKLTFDSPNTNRIIAGARVKVLSLLYVNAEYTQATYSSYNVGVGITIR